MQWQRAANGLAICEKFHTISNAEKISVARILLIISSQTNVFNIKKNLKIKRKRRKKNIKFHRIYFLFFKLKIKNSMDLYFIKFNFIHWKESNR